MAHMTTESDLGTRVVAMREERGWTRTDLLRAIEDTGTDMHMSSLRRIEAGTQEPRLSEAVGLAAALGVSLESLAYSAPQDAGATADRAVARVLGDIWEVHNALETAVVAILQLRAAVAAMDMGVRNLPTVPGVSAEEVERLKFQAEVTKSLAEQGPEVLMEDALRSGEWNSGNAVRSEMVKRVKEWLSDAYQSRLRGDF